MTSNRNNGVKSIHKLLSDFENCTDEELDRLRGKAFWFDKESSENDERLFEIQDCLLAKERKTIVFDRPQHDIKHTQLLKEFSQLTSEQKASRFILTHDFSRSSPLYRALFLWPCFTTTQSLFSPVHFELFQKKRHNNNNNNLNTTTNRQKVDATAKMQELLVKSERESIGKTTEEIILGLEDLLNALLSEIVMNGHLVVFIFDWKGGDESDKEENFRILIAFTFHKPITLLLKSLPNPLQTIRLESTDLYDHHDDGIIDAIDSSLNQKTKSGILESTGPDLKGVRQFLRQSKLSYYYHGFSLK